MSKIFLQEPRVGGCPPAIGAGHAFRIWLSGKYTCEKFNMKWIPSIKKQRNSLDFHKLEFLDYFGFNKILQEDLFDEFKEKLNIKRIPTGWRGSIKNQKQIEDFIQSNQDCDGFLLGQENSITFPILKNQMEFIQVEYFEKSMNFFKKTKGSHKRSLCEENFFNVAIMIRRGDKVFIPAQRDETDEWFLNKMESELELINPSKPIKVFIFAECYNESWWSKNQVFNKNLTPNRQWSIEDIHSEGRGVFEDFKNKNFEKIKNVYVNDQGRPVDIQNIFKGYDASLYLNHDLFSVLDTFIDSDLAISSKHGTAKLRRVFR
jgi:hypothetical protein